MHVCAWPASYKIHLNLPKKVNVLRLTQHLCMHTHLFLQLRTTMVQNKQEKLHVRPPVGTHWTKQNVTTKKTIINYWQVLPFVNTYNKGKLNSNRLVVIYIMNMLKKSGNGIYICTFTISLSGFSRASADSRWHTTLLTAFNVIRWSGWEDTCNNCASVLTPFLKSALSTATIHIFFTQHKPLWMTR